MGSFQPTPRTLKGTTPRAPGCPLCKKPLR